MSVNREKIERLAAVCAEKEMIERGHAMSNMPTDWGKRIAAMQAYAVARAEAYAARQELESAIRGEE